VIRKLAPIPVPPRSVVVERFPAIPARPRDVIIERWVPYSKEPQKRKVITYRAPQPRPYPAPRNTIIAYEPIQAHVVRSVHKVGVQQQNPHEYALRHGSSLLDAPTLVAQAQHLGINDDLVCLLLDIVTIIMLCVYFFFRVHHRVISRNTIKVMVRNII
jgi:hypothetical protein